MVCKVLWLDRWLRNEEVLVIHRIEHGYLPDLSSFYIANYALILEICSIEISLNSRPLNGPS